jgi:peptidoglycan/LPS O-acetylase OafA/YrhL
MVVAPADSKHRYLPTLDGWRTVAITMVILSHAFTTDSARNGSGSSINRLTFRLGTFGVMLFFAISGYLICTRLLVEQETYGSISLRSFYLRRVFRILPPAYTYLAVIVLLSAAGIIAVSHADLARAAFFYSNYLEPSSWFVGHFWSLAIEEHFYLLWPPILVLAGRKRAAWACVAIILVSITLRFLATQDLPQGADLPGYTHLRLDAFMFPCILAILLRDPRRAKWFASAMKPWIWLAVIVVLAAGIALGMVVEEWRDPQRVLQSALLPILIVTTVLRPEDWFARLLQLRPIEYLGRISYAIYLWQQLVFGLGFKTGIWLTAAKVPLILILAIATTKWIEEPMIALGRKISRRFHPSPNSPDLAA